MTPAYAPVGLADRIRSIDVVRGYALLGILLMNILTFGLPLAAYFNPRVAGGDTGPNLAAWVLQYVLFDGKMRGAFSLVFGAGVLLLVSRAEGRGGAGAADVHYRRMLWLMLFGIVHAYCIWVGDILYPYALLGLILYPLRKMSPRGLLIVAGIQIALLSCMNVGNGFHLRSMRDDASKADAAAARGEKLTKEQTDAQKSWKEKLEAINPNAEQIKKEIDDYRGGYISAFKRRAKDVLRWHSLPYYFPMNWDMLCMMLIGMALVKLDVLTAARPMRVYARIAAVGYAIGLPVGSVTAWMAIESRFEPMTTPFIFSSYQIARVALTLAHIAVLLMIVKSGALPWLTSRLAAVGQMAFTNYISHSVICSLIFYGYGFGLMGRLERYQIYVVVPCIWIFQLIVSPIWLRHFAFGPLEWCWRSLTYWQRQPMRLRQPEPELVAAPAGSVE
ncbi:MAG: DUF418 domain-containing protein [Bryobacteraceae bacterium]